jgi:hypothetical protein
VIVVLTPELGSIVTTDGRMAVVRVFREGELFVTFLVVHYPIRLFMYCLDFFIFVLTDYDNVEKILTWSIFLSAVPCAPSRAPIFFLHVADACTVSAVDNCSTPSYSPAAYVKSKDFGQ